MRAQRLRLHEWVLCACVLALLGAAALRGTVRGASVAAEPPPPGLATAAACGAADR